jgi:excisionase family DNA binding protein
MPSPAEVQQPLGDFSMKGVQAELDIGNTKSWELVRTGELEAYRVGRNVRVTRDSVERYKRRNRIQPWGESQTA